MTAANGDKPSVSLFVRPKIVCEPRSSISWANEPGWGIRATDLRAKPHINSESSYARGRSCCRRLFTKEIQVTCLLRFVLVLRSLLFKRSGRARFASTLAKGYYTLDTVSHGVLSACFYRTDMYAQHLSGPTINCRISTVATVQRSGHDTPHESEISCCCV